MMNTLKFAGSRWIHALKGLSLFATVSTLPARATRSWQEGKTRRLRTPLPSPPRHEQRSLQSLLVVAAISLVGLLLRIVDLDWESIWYDEACSMDMITVPLADIVSGRKLTPGNPFGYFAMLRLWCDTFGFTIESARTVSAIAGTLAIPITWLTARRLTSNRLTAHIACLLTAINPALVFLGREARVYAILSLIVTLATYFAIDVIRSRGRAGWLGMTICCAVLPHLHYYSFFFFAILGVVILWSLRHDLRSLAGRIALSATAVSVAFLPGLPLFLKQIALVRSISGSSLLHAAYFPVYIFGGRTFIWKHDGITALAIGELLVVGLIWVPMIWQLRNDRRAPWIAISLSCGVPLMAGVTSIFYMSMFNTRYVSYILPLLMVAVAYAIVDMFERRPRFGRFWSIAIVGIMTIALVRLYAGQHKDDWRSLSNYVAAHGAGVHLVFYEDIGELPFAYYQPGSSHTLIVKDFDDDGTSWDRAGYTERMAALAEFWLVIWPELESGKFQQLLAWCERRFELTDQRKFRGLHLLRFRNTAQSIQNAAARSPTSSAAVGHDTLR